MLEHDRKQAGWSLGRAAWRLGVSVREYKAIEGRRAVAELRDVDRICKLFGWPQTFVGGRSRDA